MFKALNGIVRRRSTRLVDNGCAFFPVQQRDVDVDGCMTCQFIVDFRSSEHGGVAEIVCSPTSHALAATDAWAASLARSRAGG
jgi:hypothetical protein